MTLRPRLLAPLTALLAMAVVTVTPGARAADATTRCFFGGPAGTHRVMRVDLTDGGSTMLNISTFGSRVTRPASGEESWHLAQGVFVVDEATSQIVAYRFSNAGSNPRRTVVEHDGQRAEQVTPGPDTPFVHSDLLTPPSLPPSTYLIVAFGSDGDPSLPNDGWGGFVEVSGDRDCLDAGSATLVDVNHTRFTGGTQVSTGAASVIDGATYQADFAGDLVVGFMDSSTQFAGHATLDYGMPSGAGTVDDDIVPFVSPGGLFTFTASATGVSPIISVVALAVDL